MAKAYLRLEQEDGSVLEFKKDRIKARWVKEVLKMQKKVSELDAKGDFEGQLDIMIEFVIGFFSDKKLTEDLIWDSLDSDELVPTLRSVFDGIMGGQEDTPGKPLLSTKR